MNNENIFTKNFREVQNQSPRVLTESERNNPTFVRNKDPLPDDYGFQQNLIGLGALSLLSVLTGGLTEAGISYLADLGTSVGLSGVLYSKKASDNKSQPEDAGSTKIIDVIKKPKFFPQMQPIMELPNPDELKKGNNQFPTLNSTTQFIPMGKKGL